MMYSTPKILLKIDLLENNGIEAMLVLINDYYLGNYSTSFLSQGGFMIYKGQSFSLFKTKIMCIPEKFISGSKHKSTLYFDSEKERYDYLKFLNKSLKEWSNHYHWKGYNEPEKRKILYSGKIWIVF